MTARCTATTATICLRPASSCRAHGSTRVSASTSTTTWGGVEAAYFLDTWTLHGALGYGQASVEDFDDIDADHYMGSLGARIYATDNLRFDVDGSLHRISENDLDYDLRSVKLTANYRLDAFPVTLFAGYKYTNEELSGLSASVSGDTSTLFGGLRFSYGSTTLKEEERLGPVWSSNRLAF